VPSAAERRAVHDALRVMDVVELKEFLEPSAARSRWNATFWICPKFSAHCEAGMVVNAVAAGH
jgi:hypothetical protein